MYIQKKRTQTKIYRLHMRYYCQNTTGVIHHYFPKPNVAFSRDRLSSLQLHPTLMRCV